MAQMEEALQSILGNQQAMEQIMALANSLSGENGVGQECFPQTEQEAPQLQSVPETPVFMQEERDLALLGAVKPYLRPERQEKLERALEMVRMLRMVKSAFGTESGMPK